MQCDRARILIQDSLDGEGSPALASHLSTCVDCAAEHARLLAVHTMLRTEPLVVPPRHFRSRVMARLEAQDRRRPSWQQGLMQIGVVLTGTLALALLGLLMVNGWQWTMDGTFLTEQAKVFARGAGILANVVWRPFVRDAVRMPFYAALTMGLAVAWFGTLIVPRLSRKTAQAPVGMVDSDRPMRSA